ncbi:phosphotransferase family protein [Haladaptatus sp. DYSN1]|uniref:phosphotransferase family protein n=1 Tax=unclassified Haladaptatus TaxID=2622732 RepID=UPI0024054361|nr:phosphotransferase family protein [Haladaptatus sp. DYSN1]
METHCLEPYLAEALDAEITDSRVLSEKLNRILAISTADAAPKYILHQPLKLRETCLFNELDREYRLLEALQATSIPTQKPVLYGDGDSILGGPFFVTTYLDGEPIPLGEGLPEQFRNETARREVADSLLETLADIHTLDTTPFEDVCIRQPPCEQVACAFERLDASEQVMSWELPRLRGVGEWLLENAPTDSKTTLVHGDYRPGNVLFAGSSQPKLTGVLDWETAILGDPLTEVGYLLLRWRDESDPTPDLGELETRYPDAALESLRAANERGLCPFSTQPGSPTRGELVARYEDLTGWSYDHDPFYRAHAAFMLATVWVDLHRHGVEAGDAPDLDPWVEYMTQTAELILERRR